MFVTLGILSFLVLETARSAVVLPRPPASLNKKFDSDVYRYDYHFTKLKCVENKFERFEISVDLCLSTAVVNSFYFISRSWTTNEKFWIFDENLNLKKWLFFVWKTYNEKITLVILIVSILYQIFFGKNYFFFSEKISEFDIVFWNLEKFATPVKSIPNSSKKFFFINYHISKIEECLKYCLNLKLFQKTKLIFW